MLYSETISTAPWNIDGVEVCEEKTITLYRSQTQEVTWEFKGYGLRLYIHASSLPEGIDRCVLTIKASIAGQYTFPENCHLVSAIFWIRCEPMCKLSRPIGVEIQHCAKSVNESKLSFVRAVCSQKQLPFTFKKIGGDFTHRHLYGFI